MIVLSERIEWL